MKGPKFKISYFSLISHLDPVPVYQSRLDWETLVQEKAEESRKRLLSRVGNLESLKSGDLMGPYLRRRKKAAVDQIQTIYERYGKLYPESLQFALGEEWLSMNLIPYGYDSAEHRKHIMCAAAIWILDHIDHIGKVYRLLPRNSEEIDDIYEPDIYVPEYQSDLIASVQHVLEHRNGEPEIISDGGRRVFMDFASTNETFDRTVMTEDRQRFEELIGLIPREAIEHAVQSFEQLIWRFTDLYFEELQPLVEKNSNLLAQYERIYTRYKAAVETANDAIREFNKTGMLKSKMAESSSPVLSAAVQNLNPPLSVSAYENTDALTLIPESEELLLDIVEKAEELERKLRSVMKQLMDVMRAEADYRIRVVVDGFMEVENKYGIADPYAICFALLYLVDTGSDLPWLYGPGIGVIHAVTDLLPWGIGGYTELEDTFLEAGKESDLNPAWHDRKYTREDDNIPRSLVQILCETTGCIVPRRFRTGEDQMKLIKGYGIENPDMFLAMMNTLAECRRQSRPLNLDTDWTWNENGEVQEKGAGDRLPMQTVEQDTAYAEKENRINTILEINKKLRTQLYTAEREAHEARKKLEAMQETAKREHRELADLRTLVFTAEENKNTSSAERNPAETAFPLEIQKETIIFGGHDSWVKAIRPLLNGTVRYVAKEVLSFDASIIRSAQVIWVQTAAMSHAQYDRIMNAARHYQIQLRYFSSTSAHRCAVELAQNDQPI